MYLMVFEFIIVVMCIHEYVDESANHGVESSVFVLCGVVGAVVYEAYDGGGFPVYLVVVFVVYFG